MSFKFITKEKLTTQLYFQLPKALIYESKYKDVSNDSKILYAFLFDRTKLSIENNWFDEFDRAYIICEIDEVMLLLNCKNQKAVKCMKDLEKKSLIMKKRQGLNMPNLIYVAEVDTSADTLKVHVNYHNRMLNALKTKRKEDNELRKSRKCENHTSIDNTTFLENDGVVNTSDSNGNVKITFQEVWKSHQNNTNNKEVSKYVCSIKEIYEKYLITSPYAKVFLDSIENKFDKDLFETILIDVLNNNRVKHKEKYFIKKINELIKKDITSVKLYEESVSEYVKTLKPKKKTSKTLTSRSVELKGGLGKANTSVMLEGKLVVFNELPDEDKQKVIDTYIEKHKEDTWFNLWKAAMEKGLESLNSDICKKQVVEYAKDNELPIPVNKKTNVNSDNIGFDK